MSALPQPISLKSYVEQYLTLLQGEIEQWLACLNKTLDDVVWWEIDVVNVEPSFYRRSKWKYRIKVAFAGSDEKHETTLLSDASIGMDATMFELKKRADRLVFFPQEIKQVLQHVLADSPTVYEMADGDGPRKEASQQEVIQVVIGRIADELGIQLEVN